MFLPEKGSFQECHTNSSSNKIQSPLDMHLGKCLYIYRTLFTKKSGILEQLGILEETKDVTEWVNSFVIMENKIPTDSNSSQGHSMNKKLRICLDPRDLNEALEREPYYTWSIEIMAKSHGMTRFTIADS